MNAKENFSIFRHWKTNGHVLFLILLQIVFIVLFALFVVYDPTAESSAIPKGTYYLKNEIDCSYILQDQIIKHKNGTESNVKTKVKNTYTSEQGQQILGNYPGKHLKVKVDGLVTLIKIILNSLNKFALTAGIGKLIQIIPNFHFSFPRCPRYDLYWHWIFDDFFEKIRSFSCIPQYVDSCGMSSMGTFGLWMDAFTLWKNLF